MDHKSREKGFTLLEVMIALGIFGVLMLAVVQMMRMEIWLFDSEDKQNQIEVQARMAMNNVLDQVRLHGYVYYGAGDGYDEGLYSDDPDLEQKCLLNLNPDPAAVYDDIQMYYLADEDQLWYRDSSGSTYIIADQITVLEIHPENDHLVRIRVGAGEPSSDYYFELVTWGRLY